MYEFSDLKIIHHLDRLWAICRGELSPPVTVEIELTNACNHRCIFCLDQSYNAIINATLKEAPLLNLAAEIAGQGVESVIFTGGGEPLLYYSFSKIVQHFRTKGLHIGLITNGEAIDRHLEAIPHLSWVQVSLDAASVEIHQKLHNPFKNNIFQTIVDNLYQISTSVFTGISYVLHPDNFRQMPAAIRLAREVGCRFIAFRRVDGLPQAQSFTPAMLMELRELMAGINWRQEANFQILAPRLDHFAPGYRPLPYSPCLAHHLIGILSSDGNFYPCRTLRGDADYAYGSIYRDSFQNIWYGEKRKAVLEKIARGDCSARCLGHTFYLRYDHYNHWLEYLSRGRDRVGHVEFL
ncbi:MAG: radical SAM protein [bacterium]|nr:radical SAM protein [bacterium]